ncbi:chromatin-associated RNAPIII regulator FPT1 NDAI_0B04960 [Naumovozyma dairenensis CBS 421]|uniref:Uncharacterized protein n=1 Tax=Naumovozyma dairenensis (strain ATCC 10597 / BCRC 20456 / CBS 421 / NBRC 0211 / NRRL Y-12639) TaxID=1071378 RepID=G0W6W8_NAUDC|nr:hypothetical protein NDAI_0B04960 [Naumovozyma dairenensis CBS 421]CCD23529.1 hypothetical protein NDAI_0B04960 [Naumovozyma dairenensis CBS 421]
MTSSETIYLYGGKDHPKVRLVCQNQFKRVSDLIDYLHSIQDTYYVQFTSSETITENLKLTCSMEGLRFPFFVLEYNEVCNSFYLWKSDGNFDIMKIISYIYENHCNTYSKDKPQHNNWEDYFRNDKRFMNHMKKDMLEESLNELNINWDDVDLDEFWSHLNTNLKSHMDMEPEASYKSFISISVLKAHIVRNKKNIEQVLKDYEKKCRRTISHVVSEDESHSSKINDSETSEIFEQKTSTTRESSPHAMNASGSLLAPPTKSDAYTYNVLRTIPKPSVPATEQLISNFNSHFKWVTDDYELFDLQTKAGIPRRVKFKTGKVSKVQQEKKSAKNTLNIK